MAAFSFLSALSVVTAPSQPDFPSGKFGRTNGRIRCHYEMEESEANMRVQEKQLNRRDVLRCFSTVVGLEMLAGSGSLTHTAIAADLIQRRQRSEFQANIKETLFDAIKGHLELIPSILRLALNDALTFDKATKTGGPNGSIRLRWTF
ncbi:Thylakoid lumenal 29 kDa protein, chloroplastic [Dendrobium catenatum]|uniref:Thylakoid lumenal 29 kDa protein, chloroplastic n=1 Tax=Dendrobium catenatum TaxID=906689 RepID=A0A2I0VFA8_9ASPA|nr:Thylakoid lumenal 29 kDa protein, chloroplastic [Dendrobium catenatum]